MIEFGIFQEKSKNFQYIIKIRNRNYRKRDKRNNRNN